MAGTWKCERRAFHLLKHYVCLYPEICTTWLQFVRWTMSPLQIKTVILFLCDCFCVLLLHILLWIQGHFLFVNCFSLLFCSWNKFCFVEYCHQIGDVFLYLAMCGVCVCVFWHRELPICKQNTTSFVINTLWVATLWLAYFVFSDSALWLVQN